MFMAQTAITVMITTTITTTAMYTARIATTATRSRFATP